MISRVLRQFSVRYASVLSTMGLNTGCIATKFPYDITSVGAGPENSAFITKEGDIFTWGANTFGQLGHGDETERDTEARIELLHDLKIHCKKVGFGSEHMCILTEDGEVLTCGKGGKFLGGAGALGLGVNGNRATPTLVEFFGDNNLEVIDISCGEKHNLALTKCGKVYTWGAGDHGRLGVGGSSGSKVPIEVDFFEDEKVDIIAAGAAFNLVSTANNGMYSWGRNDQCQLGHGISVSGDMFALSQFPARIAEAEKAKSLAGGPGYAACITPDNRVMHWGQRDKIKPTELTFFKENGIIPDKLAVGDRFAVLLDTEGHVYGWGSNRQYQLGAELPKVVKVPTLLPDLEKLKATDVACGDGHIVVIGDIFDEEEIDVASAVEEGIIEEPKSVTDETEETAINTEENVEKKE
eukprot:TRINITY_DN774150_c0_g1_i1.p1 TRINITY_DN774150_c0_g1~~TRINITY_DN774150_c0_g1_i1.p1  ORF type:complete len:410 (+),score=168.37 TRINITY_DN774150_c0_g1_i1:85-1314(+)